MSTRFLSCCCLPTNKYYKLSLVCYFYDRENDQSAVNVYTFILFQTYRGHKLLAYNPFFIVIQHPCMKPCLSLFSATGCTRWPPRCGNGWRTLLWSCTCHCRNFMRGSPDQQHGWFPRSLLTLERDPHPAPCYR